MKIRVLKLGVVVAFLIAVVLGQQMVADARDDGCVYDMGICVDTQFCCVIPGQCEKNCQYFGSPSPHCHCVPVG